MKHEKKILDACLMDNDYMSRYFKDSNECVEYVLNAIIAEDHLTVRQVSVQERITNLWGRDVILDIYATDSNFRGYNIEIQKDSRGLSEKRARYHSSLIDANTAISGSEFESLLETYVIFISEFDVLGAGKAVYHINRIVEETGKAFKDDAHIIYVNAQIKDDTELGKVMHDFFCINPEDMKCEILAKQAWHYKRTQEGMKIMSDYIESQVEERMAGKEQELIQRGVEIGEKIGEQRGEKIGEQRGKAEGKTEGKEEAACELLEHNVLSKEDIARMLHLSLERVEKLAKHCSNKQN